jgi:hypothetical protein
MKKTILVVMLLYLSLNVFAYDYYDHLDITYTEVPYKPVYAFLGINFEAAGASQNGMSITMTSAREQDLQFEVMLDYRKVKELSVFDIMLGGTYLPRYPTFEIGLPARLKISALGGLAMGNEEMGMGMLLSTGLLFSFGREEANGILLALNYRPGTIKGVADSLGFSFGFLFAPVAQ